MNLKIEMLSFLFFYNKSIIETKRNISAEEYIDAIKYRMKVIENVKKSNEILLQLKKYREEEILQKIKKNI